MSEPLLHPHRALLDDELTRLRDIVTNMGEFVDKAITNAVQALTDRDLSLGAAVIAEDSVLNERQRELRELAFTVILTQTPVARDLREIIGLLYMSSEFERM